MRHDCKKHKYESDYVPCHYCQREADSRSATCYPPHFRVAVAVDGGEVLTIESNSLSGVENVTDYRKEILEAAKHLIAFIGNGDTEFLEDNAESLPPADTTQNDR